MRDEEKMRLPIFRILILAGILAGSMGTMIWMMPERSLKSMKRMEPKFLLLATQPNKVTCLPTSLIESSVLRHVLSILFAFFLVAAFATFATFMFMMFATAALFN